MWILEYGCLCTALFFFPYSVEQNLTLTLVVFHSITWPASRDIDVQVTAWKFHCPSSPYSVSPRQGTCWETNVYAGRIDLHLKFAIWQWDWHCCATRFRNLQGGIKTLHDAHFGCRPLCLIFSFAVIMSEINPTESYWSQEYHSLPLSAR